MAITKAFSGVLNNFAKESAEKQDKVFRRSAFRLAAQVDVRSPVDKGTFRANWIGSFGTADSSTFDSASRDSVGIVLQLLSSSKPSETSVFYYVNNLPYAQRLEDGYSAQAPNGMVALTARNWSRYVKEEARRILND